LSGYTLKGWFTAASGGTRVGVGGQTITLSGTGNRTFYAQWTAVRYFIYYNNNASTGGGVPAPQNGTIGSSVTVRENDGGTVQIALTRTGYTFGGWNTRADGTGSNYTAGTGQFTFSAQNQTLFARWIPIAYTVTFNNNGGSGSMAVQNTLHGVTTSLNMFNTGTLVAPTGKVFGGWTTNANGSGTAYADGAPITPTGSITLFARWLQQL
jgi:uncharacterized repeat protein (TIGR02543 family)